MANPEIPPSIEHATSNIDAIELEKLGLDPQKLPQHVAIIMDGNGRWAKKRGAMRVFGHQNAVKAVRDTTEAAAEWGIKYLTLYAFSTENWNRPKAEVNALMELLVQTIRNERNTLLKNGVRLAVIGDMDGLPANCQKSLLNTIEETANGNRMTLTLALNYGARTDILRAIQLLALDVLDGKLKPDTITESVLRQKMTTSQLPDPELLIRTSGEMRISNFLLWEIAYTEIYITPQLWPDFRRNDLLEALQNYQQRERRFGKTSEQLKSDS